MRINLESHITGERLDPAVRTASELLCVEPDTEKANAFLARVKLAFESHETAMRQRNIILHSLAEPTTANFHGKIHCGGMTQTQYKPSIQ